MPRILAALGGILLLAAFALVYQTARPKSPLLQPPAPASFPPAVEVPEAPADLRVPGTFIYARQNDLWRLTHRSDSQRLTSLPSGSFPAYPAASPDGRQVAFSLYLPSNSATDPGGTDLYLMDRDGSNLRVLVAHDLPGSTLEAPAWSSDGKALLYTYRAQEYRDNRFVGEVLRVERMDPATGQREPLLTNASHASYFPDGKRLVYIATDLKSYAQSLWVANADGTDPQQVLKEGLFSALFAPRPSPDGRAIVFAASGETQDLAPGGAKGRGPADLPAWLAAWTAPRLAEAHGIPWDLWTIRSDGGGLRRLTTVVEDTPYPVWMPGGEKIAFLGERALYLVDRDGRQVVRLAEEFGGIGLTWLPD